MEAVNQAPAQSTGQTKEITTEEKLNPGIYFIHCKGPDLSNVFLTMQEGLNGAQFKDAEIQQILTTQEIKVNTLTRQQELLHVVVAIMVIK